MKAVPILFQNTSSVIKRDLQRDCYVRVCVFNGTFFNASTKPLLDFDTFLSNNNHNGVACLLLPLNLFNYVSDYGVSPEIWLTGKIIPIYHTNENLYFQIPLLHTGDP